MNLEEWKNGGSYFKYGSHTVFYREEGEGEVLICIHGFPTYLVIDGDGVIKERITGLNPQETVVHRLKATLGQMPQLEGVARK